MFGEGVILNIQGNSTSQLIDKKYHSILGEIVQGNIMEDSITQYLVKK